jgi:hypothetical protein
MTQWHLPSPSGSCIGSTRDSGTRRPGGLGERLVAGPVEATEEHRHRKPILDEFVMLTSAAEGRQERTTWSQPR